MRSSLYRRTGYNNSDVEETDPLLPAIPGPGPSVQNEHGSTINDGSNASVLIPNPGKKYPQYAAALAANIGALAAGVMLGWSSPVMYRASQPNSTAYDFPISATESDGISSIINLGAAGICYPIGIVMDSFGRKNTMLFLVLPFTAGWLFITFARNVGMLMIGRLLTGIAGGAFCVTAPTYTSEIAQDSIRGTLGTFYQLMVTIGILFSYVFGSYMSSVFTFNFICTLFPIAFGILFSLVPESPSFLVVKGRYDKAREALILLRGDSYDVNGELEKLKYKADEMRHNNTSFLKNITKKTALKAILICYALMMFQQFSGINAVLFNTSSIFESATTLFSPAVGTILIGVIQVIATFSSSMVVDRLGRRFLLLTSSFVMCLCTTVLGIYFFLKEHGASEDKLNSISWIPLLSLSLFIISFSFGFGPIPWIMAGELCFIDIKAFVSSTSGTLSWLLSLAVTSSFHSLSGAIGTGQVFWVFAGFTVAALLFVFLVIPETKGKSMDEIQILLGGDPQPQRVIDQTEDSERGR